MIFETRALLESLVFSGVCLHIPYKDRPVRSVDRKVDQESGPPGTLVCIPGQVIQSLSLVPSVWKGMLAGYVAIYALGREGGSYYF